MLADPYAALSALGAVATALVAVAAVLVAQRQLSAIALQGHEEARRHKIAATSEMCEKHTVDPIIHACSLAIRQKATLEVTGRDGLAPAIETDYGRLSEAEPQERSKLKVDVMTVLNYFEALAIGLENGIYDEPFVHSYFGKPWKMCAIRKVVDALLLGRAGPTWASAPEKLILSPPEIAGYPHLQKLYRKWQSLADP